MRTFRTLPCPAVKKTVLNGAKTESGLFFKVSHSISLCKFKVHAAARIAVSRHNSGRRPRRASGWSFLKTWGPGCTKNPQPINGNSRILKWRYCTI